MPGSVRICTPAKWCPTFSPLYAHFAIGLKMKSRVKPVRPSERSRMFLILRLWHQVWIHRSSAVIFGVGDSIVVEGTIRRV